MKIAVASEGPSLDDSVSTRFARAPYFLFVDADSLKFEAVTNQSTTDVAAGLGLKAAWLVVNRGASTIIAGRVGGNARRILDEHGVKIVADRYEISGGVKVREAITRYR